MADTERLINKEQGDSIISAIQGITARLQEMYTVDDAMSSSSENPVQNKVITAALDNKVDKVEGKGLSTNDYTNEEKASVANSAEQLESTQTVSGNPLTLTDCAPINAESLVVEFSPKQDLHGQSAPYVGGAGKNKFGTSLIWRLQNSANNDGVISNTTADNRDAFFFAVSVISGDTVVVTAETKVVSENGRCYQTITIPNGSNPDTIRISHTGGAADIGLYATFRETGTYTVSLDLLGHNPSVVGGLSFKDIQIEEGSTMTSFAPYTNICPITGYNECEVESAGNILPADYAEWTESGNYSYFKIPNFNGETYTIRVVDKDPTVDLGRCSIGFIDNYPTEIVDFTWVVDEGVEQTNHTNVVNNVACDTIVLYPAAQSTLETLLERYEIFVYSSAQSTSASISFGQTVYGGKVDFLTGKLIADTAYITVGDLSWNYDSTTYGLGLLYSGMSNLLLGADGGSITCSSYKYVTYDAVEVLNNGEIWNKYYAFNPHNIVIRDTRYNNATDFVNENSNVQICYTLVTPIEIQLTPQELKLLKQYNNITTNGTTINLGYQPDNVIGEVKGEIEAITEMDYLRILDNNVDTPINNYRIYYHLISGAYALVNMAEMLNHRFIFIEVIKNPSGGVNQKVLHSALIDPRTIDGFEYEMKASGNDTIWIESILDENKFNLSLRTTGGSYSDGDPTDYYVTIRMVD